MTVDDGLLAGQLAPSTNSAIGGGFHPQSDPHLPAVAAHARHARAPHELRNAWLTAKQLEERLEIADQVVLCRLARYIREEVFAELMRVEGYQEVPDDA